MGLDISIILAFEQTTILAGREKEWSQYQSLGSCYLPQVVLEELEFLTQRAVLPEEEQTARAFARFFPNSGWQIHQGMTAHQALQPLAGENLSKNVRLQSAIAQSIYDLSINNPDKLVVFICNQGNLRQNLDKIKPRNFTSLTLAQFNQWLRTKEKPATVTQIIEQLTNPSDSPSFTSSNYPHKQKKTSPTSLPRTKKTSSKTNPLSTIISSLLALGALTVAVMLSWYLIQPDSFQKFWQQNFPARNS